MTSFLSLFTLILFLSPSYLFATPHFSSKAVRVAASARTIVLSEKSSSGDLQKAAQSLETLFLESSFLRLEQGDQVHIIIILSQIYERLKKWDTQVKMLSSYSKKKEFHRYSVRLQTELIRSYILQKKFRDADIIIKRVLGRSCANLPQEEKRQIAAVVLMRDAHLSQQLHLADLWRIQGNYRSSSHIYRTLLSAIERKSYPFQSSPLERKKLYIKIMLSLCESYIMSNKQEKAYPLLTQEEIWNRIPYTGKEHDQIVEKRTFLLILTYLRMKDPVRALETFFFLKKNKKKGVLFPHSFLDSLILIEKEPIETFQEKVENVLQLSSPKMAFWSSLFHYFTHQTPIPFMNQNGSLINSTDQKYVEGVHQIVQFLYEGKLGNAKTLLDSLLKEHNNFSLLQKETIQLLYTIKGDLLWNELFLYAILGMDKAAERIVQKIEKLSETATLEASTERVFFWKNRIRLIVQRGSQEEIIQHFNSCNRKFPSLIETSYSMPYIGIRALKRAFSSFSHSSSSLDEEIVNGLYKECTMFFKSCDDEEGISLFSHLLSDLALRERLYQDAFSLFLHVVGSYSSYPNIAQFGYHILFKTQQDAEFYSKEREAVLLFLCQHVPDNIYTYISLIIDDHTLLIGRNSKNPFIQTFSQAIDLRKRAKRLYGEAKKAKDPGTMKEKYEQAFTLYKEASYTAYSLLMSEEIDRNPPLKELLQDTLLSIDTEWLLGVISIFHRYDVSYNELGSSLEKARCCIASHAHLFNPKEIWEKKEKFMRQTYALQVTPIYTAIFSHNFEEAIQGLQSLPNESLERIRAILLLCHSLRESGYLQEEEPLLLSLNEEAIQKFNRELALAVAFEKALFSRAIEDYDQAMSYLGWIINDSYASSLRIRAMIMRGDIYSEIGRKDLAIRQFESVSIQGGEWAKTAQKRKEALQNHEGR